MDELDLIAGIGPGGMHDKYEVKILICYLLNNCSKPITQDQLNFIFQNEKIVNYFTYSDAISELFKSEHIFEKEHSDHKKYLYLNELGVTTSQTLKHMLPRSLKDNVIAACMKLLAKLKTEKENEVTVTPFGTGFNVECIIHDTDFDLMKLTVFAPDEMQATRIKNNFLNSPTNIYSGLINLLTTDD